MEPDDNRNIFSEKEWKSLQRQLELFPRQLDIAKLLCEGHKNYSVAKELGISINTVRTHLRQLYNKLDVTDRFEMLCLFVNTYKSISSAQITSEKTNCKKDKSIRL